jgi:hypothetical protein
LIEVKIGFRPGFSLFPVIIHPESQVFNRKRMLHSTRMVSMHISTQTLAATSMGLDLCGFRVLQLHSGLLQDRSDEPVITTSMIPPALQRWSLWLASAASMKMVMKLICRIP